MKLIEKATRLVVILSAALCLVACGGDDAPVAAATVVTGSTAGVLVDSAVGGVAYTTSSGVTGTTAADGSYRFNPGDTVTFRLGGLTLGTATATGIISPMDLAAGSSLRLQNLLVLLQSLDSDGNPANGVTIPAAGAAAVTASVSLAGSTETFATDAALQAAMTAGGIAGAPKSPAVARAHFIAQAMPLLSANIWYGHAADAMGKTRTVVLNIEASGKFVQLETGEPELDGDLTLGSSGIETGTLTVAGFTPSGYALTATTATDGNASWGMSTLAGCGRLRNAGERLVTAGCTTPNGALGLLANSKTGFAGGWRVVYADESDTAAIDYYFLPDGHFVVAFYNPTCVQFCRSDARHGTYTAVDGVVTMFRDGDLVGQPGTYTFSPDGLEMTLSPRGSTIRTFTRLAR